MLGELIEEHDLLRDREFLKDYPDVTLTADRVDFVIRSAGKVTSREMDSYSSVGDYLSGLRAGEDAAVDIYNRMVESLR